MKRLAAVPCSTAVELFRGLYARVGRDLGLDASYISRVARGERRSEVAADSNQYRVITQLPYGISWIGTILVSSRVNSN